MLTNLKIDRLKSLAFPYLPFWRPSDYAHSVSAQKSLGGGVLLELSHEYDYLKALFGVPKNISCNTSKVSDLNIDVEDLAVSVFNYESNFFIEVHQDMISQPPKRNLRIVGNKEYVGILETI
jgi:predicted dehydrogenase